MPVGENWRGKMFQLLDIQSSATKPNFRVMNLRHANKQFFCHFL